METWFENLFGFKESTGAKSKWGHGWQETKGRLRLGDGLDEGLILSSTVNSASYQVGHFESISLAHLRERGAEALAAERALDGCLRLSHAEGDISVLMGDHPLAVVQVASQFNCLEFVGPNVTPEAGVTDYVSDRTQGPACSIACGPATVYRNYFATVKSCDGTAYEGQTLHQLENLRDLSMAVGNKDELFFKVKNGYTIAKDTHRIALTDLIAQTQ